MDQLYQSLSIFQFLLHKTFGKFDHPPSNLFILSFSYIHGILDLSLMPGEAATILLKAECQLWWDIFHQEIDQGCLASLIQPVEYLAPSEVSTPHIYFNAQLLTFECYE